MADVLDIFTLKYFSKLPVRKIINQLLKKPHMLTLYHFHPYSCAKFWIIEVYADKFHLVNSFPNKLSPYFYMSAV